VLASPPPSLLQPDKAIEEKSNAASGQIDRFVLMIHISSNRLGFN
jgi:hypothetical protein